ITLEPQQQRQVWRIDPQSESPVRDLVTNRPDELKFRVTVPENVDFTRPYFSRPDIHQAYYDISDEQFLHAPLAPYPVAGWAYFTYVGVLVQMGNYVQPMKGVPGRGSFYEPLAVGPAIGVGIAPRAGITPLEAKSFPVTAIVHSNTTGAVSGTIRLDLP